MYLWILVYKSSYLFHLIFTPFVVQYTLLKMLNILDDIQGLCSEMEIAVVLKGSSLLGRQVKNKIHINKTIINCNNGIGKLN